MCTIRFLLRQNIRFSHKIYQSRLDNWRDDFEKHDARDTVVTNIVEIHIPLCRARAISLVPIIA